MIEIIIERIISRAGLAAVGPVVVHCSAGIGRTGCFIAICIGMRQLSEENMIDVLGIVCQMRLDRCTLDSSPSLKLIFFQRRYDPDARSVRVRAPRARHVRDAARRQFLSVDVTWRHWRTQSLKRVISKALNSTARTFSLLHTIHLSRREKLHTTRHPLCESRNGNERSSSFVFICLDDFTR